MRVQGGRKVRDEDHRSPLGGHTQAAYTRFMKGMFVELPSFERYRSTYLDDDAFLLLQNLLMNDPEAGDLIPETEAFASCVSPIKDAARGSEAGYE